MSISVGIVVFDSTDPSQLCEFWCALLDVSVESNIGEGQFCVLGATEDGTTLGFQRVPESKSMKNRMHLDLMVADLDAATIDIERLGGTWLAERETYELEGWRWRRMADPEGNEFDIDVAPSD